VFIRLPWMHSTLAWRNAKELDTPNNSKTKNSMHAILIEEVISLPKLFVNINSQMGVNTNTNA